MAYLPKKAAPAAEQAIAASGIPARLDALLWQALGNGETPVLAELFEAAQGKPREHVVAETIIVQDVNPLEVIHPKRYATYVPRTVGGVSAIKIDDDRGDFVLSAWPTAHDGVFHLIASIPSTDPRWGKVDRWVSRARPHAVRCFLDHDDFIAIGTALSEHDEVEVQRVSGRKHADRSTWNRSFRAYDSDHLRPDHREMVAEAESVGVSLRTLHMHVGDVMDVVVRRVAGATFNKGDFEVFENRVLSRLATAAARRRDLFVDRERRLNQPPKQPIEVRLAAPLFTDPEATGEVIQMLERTSDISFAVVHRNPYLHVVITDNTDGSNYDLFVTSPDAIEIHPGFRASLGSLTRLSQDLGDYFEADNLRETPVAEPSSIFDLIG